MCELLAVDTYIAVALNMFSFSVNYQVTLVLYSQSRGEISISPSSDEVMSPSNDHSYKPVFINLLGNRL